MTDAVFNIRFRRELRFVNFAYRLLFWSHQVIYKFIFLKVFAGDQYEHKSVSCFSIPYLRKVLRGMESEIFGLWEGLVEANDSLPKTFQLKIKPPPFFGTLAELKKKSEQRQRAYKQFSKSYFEEDYCSS